jgi:Biotin-lipoyl like
VSADLAWRQAGDKADGQARKPHRDVDCDEPFDAVARHHPESRGLTRQPGCRFQRGPTPRLATVGLDADGRPRDPTPPRGGGRAPARGCGRRCVATEPGRGEATQPLTLYGNVDIRQLDLTCNESDRVVRMYVDEGDAVEPGQLLAELDGSRIEHLLAEAQAPRSCRFGCRAATGDCPTAAVALSSSRGIATPARDVEAAPARVRRGPVPGLGLRSRPCSAITPLAAKRRSDRPNGRRLEARHGDLPRLKPVSLPPSPR